MVGGGVAGLAELAAVMMGGAQRRVDVTAENVTNMSTPAYRSRRVFSQIFDLRQALPSDVVALVAEGGAALKATGNPLDIATDSSAVLRLRSGDSFTQSRAAQLHQDANGMLVDGQGRILQADGGGDLNVGAGTAQILKDGTVLVAGQAVGKIGLFQADDAVEGGSQSARATGHVGVSRGNSGGGHAHSARSSEGGILHTGMLVAADVDLGAEMVELTKASRQAETGARIFSVYDDLLGTVASKLGELAK